MVYENLSFPILPNRPYFFSDFVATIDGKVQVTTSEWKKYWPIGSKTDYDTFTYLRAHADAIIDGKSTALQFGKRTIDRLHDNAFQKLRSQLGKKNPIEYIVLTTKPNNELSEALQNHYDFTPTLFTKSLEDLIIYLQQKGYKTVFVDGGPTVIGSFLKAGLLDELFVTIAPKFFGNRQGRTLTMVEGILFPAEKVKHAKLISVKQVDDEVYLRYKL